MKASLVTLALSCLLGSGLAAPIDELDMAPERISSKQIIETDEESRWTLEERSIAEYDGASPPAKMDPFLCAAYKFDIALDSALSKIPFIDKDQPDPRDQTICPELREMYQKQKKKEEAAKKGGRGGGIKRRSQLRGNKNSVSERTHHGHPVMKRTLQGELDGDSMTGQSTPLSDAGKWPQCC
ncbi:hypothetical protein HIM_08352 [Hirsutella minnesotensis 3608]|uniref:Uncharacterized protein n=1 Tax=Hirsutella minnesotensis 3608 TaxID=1043627 RepID=A0A0F7ZML5_9HYPO|nr:hypothetical protein HIM_08352 [Hirsutella minnesotensis 3608]